MQAHMFMHVSTHPEVMPAKREQSSLEEFFGGAFEQVAAKLETASTKIRTRKSVQVKVKLT